MTVFIVDDDPAVCDSLALMIDQAELPVEWFNDPLLFLDRCQADIMGCLLVDFNMPGMNGIQVQQEIKKRKIPLPIIFLTGHGNIPLSVQAMKSGALDFLTKPVTREKLLSCIRAALQECLHLQDRTQINQYHQALLATLTERELQVMQLMLEGQTNKKVAQCLGISHRTVEIHKARMMQKTGAGNLLELARIAQSVGGLQMRE